MKKKLRKIKLLCNRIVCKEIEIWISGKSVKFLLTLFWFDDKAIRTL